MKSKRILTVLGILMLAGLMGCSLTLTTREKGAALGTAAGAGLGAIIGNQSGHTGAGAAIGGLIGLGAGALIGDQLQKQEQEREQQKRELEQQRYELERLKRKGTEPQSKSKTNPSFELAEPMGY